MANDNLTVGEVLDEGALPNPSQIHDSDDDISFSASALTFDLLALKIPLLTLS